MCILLTVTDKVSEEKKKLTKGLISEITENTDGSANILLRSENISFNTNESYEWVISTYQKLKD